MGIDRRTFIVSNLHRDSTTDDNNDLNITLPDSIFSGKLESVNLNHISIDFDTENIGSSNNQLYVAYPSSGALVSITLNLNRTTSTVIKTDSDLASLLAERINTALGTNVFQVYQSTTLSSYQDVYRDNSDLINRYTIFTNSNTDFKLDFSAKNSIGPLLGFGNSTYSGSYTYTGGNIPPLYPYESIHVSNQAHAVFKQYDQNTDIACKMDLYDSNGALIPNSSDPRDTTISLPILNGYIYSVDEFITYLTTEMNTYSSHFTGNPEFIINYDHITGKFTIRLSNDDMFGIGFRFDRGDGRNNYGSLHKHLGFSKNIYLGLTSITSIYPAKIFSRTYLPDYLFICSDLIKHNYDASMIIPSSNGGSTFLECLFAIPINMIDENHSYGPVNENEHRVRIHASRLAKQYNESLTGSKTINLYLKLSSGRHIKLNSQWQCKFEIDYIN